MKAVIICPDRRPATSFLARKTPLALVPALGPSVLAHWLTALADRGVKEVIIFASDRPDQVRVAVGRGERWGVRLEVRAEASELSVAAAAERVPGAEAIIADRLPGLPDSPLFASCAGFFSVLAKWSSAAGKQRVGAREITPGIWAGLRCKIDPTASLTAPCWLGENVWVRAGAKIGPDALVEDGVVVDHHAELADAWIGPRTYVGALTQVKHSFAWGDGLLNYMNGSFTEVVDAFLLGDLHGEAVFARNTPWPGRAGALLLLVLTSPIVVVAWLKNRGAKNLFLRKRAVVPTAVAGPQRLRELDYPEFGCFRGQWRRWPQLWCVVRGDFAWVGNRPLTGAQAAQLETEFEQLWLSAPIGLFSLADTLGCGDDFSDEARAHASFYAVRAGRRLNHDILRRIIMRASPKIWQ